MGEKNQTYSILLNLIREKGFSSVTELAQKMGKRPNTLINGLKYFAKNLNYDSKFAFNLIRTLEISEEELRLVIEDEKERIEQVDYEKIIGDLNLKDVVVIIVPRLRKALEFQNFELNKHITKAILKGVRFLFVYHNENPNKKQSLLNIHSSIRDTINLTLFLAEIHTNKPKVEEFYNFFLTPILIPYGEKMTGFHSYIIINMNNEKVYEDIVLNGFFPKNDYWIKLPRDLGAVVIDSIDEKIANSDPWHSTPNTKASELLSEIREHKLKK